jgi:hypothetical protein
MSTTFDIIPTETDEITFGQVLVTSERNIHAFLNSIGIEHVIQLQINLHENNEKYVKEIQMTEKFEWGENEYVWFTINGIAGGTDAYCCNIKDNDIDPENPWWRLDDLEQNNKAIENIKEKLEKSKTLNRLWSFRRSAGQPGIIALSYGLISASVAELTNGLLWSDDGAWDFQRFPAESKDFLTWYFRPDQTLDADKADWVKRCIDGISEELTAPNSTLPKAGQTWWQKLFSSE